MASTVVLLAPAVPDGTPGDVHYQATGPRSTKDSNKVKAIASCIKARRCTTRRPKNHAIQTGLERTANTSVRKPFSGP
jgi:hypothetical protein